MLQNLFIWIITFLCASLVESSARVLLFHSDWNASSTANYAIMNLLPNCALGILGGALYSILIFVVSRNLRWKRLLDFLRPTVAAAAAAFLSLGCYYNRYLLPVQSPSWVRRLILVACFLLVYIACRKLVMVSGSHLRRGIVLLIILFPLFTFTMQFIRNFSERASGTSTGQIRHIVLISIDTLRYDYVGCYGSKKARTPNIDLIAQEGARFSVAISPVPVTGPAHTSMLTGLFPLSSGIFFNGERLPKRSSTVTEELRKYGFKTAGFISGYPLTARNSGLDQGFQVYDDNLAPIDTVRESWAGTVVEKTALFRPGILIFGTDVTNRAMSWLEGNYENSFFLFLHYYDVHYPYDFTQKRTTHPQWIISRPQDLPRQERLYANAVESVDIEIGRVVSLLKQKGVYDQTLLIITADHGESLGEHNYYYDHHKKVYEQLVRVPLVIRCPTLVQAGRQVEEQVSLTDIPRTILDSTGLRQTEFQGYDLVAMAKKIPEKYDRALVSQSFETKTDALRTKQWKLIRNSGQEETGYELYDLQSDPEETVNLFKIETQVSEKLKNQLFQLIGAGSRGKRSEELSPEQKERFRSLGYVQ